MGAALAFGLAAAFLAAGFFAAGLAAFLAAGFLAAGFFATFLTTWRSFERRVAGGEGGVV